MRLITLVSVPVVTPVVEGHALVETEMEANVADGVNVTSVVLVQVALSLTLTERLVLGEPDERRLALDERDVDEQADAVGKARVGESVSVTVGLMDAVSVSLSDTGEEAVTDGEGEADTRTDAVTDCDNDLGTDAEGVTLGHCDTLHVCDASALPVGDTLGERCFEGLVDAEAHADDDAVPEGQ